jgi:hypothetical protein
MSIDTELLYEIVSQALDATLDKREGSARISLARRMSGGMVVFEDGQKRTAKEIPVGVFFKKVTSVREKLRVLEQKINSSASLDETDKAELQGYITRCYGSLTTFNFLFQDEDDKFKGVGGE